MPRFYLCCFLFVLNAANARVFRTPLFTTCRSFLPSHFLSAMDSTCHCNSYNCVVSIFFFSFFFFFFSIFFLLWQAESHSTTQVKILLTSIKKKNLKGKKKTHNHHRSGIDSISQGVLRASFAIHPSVHSLRREEKNRGCAEGKNLEKERMKCFQHCFGNPLPGKFLEKYELKEQIGAGGFAVVHRCVKRGPLSKQVQYAAKVINLAFTRCGARGGQGVQAQRVEICPRYYEHFAEERCSNLSL